MQKYFTKIFLLTICLFFFDCQKQNENKIQKNKIGKLILIDSLIIENLTGIIGEIQIVDYDSVKKNYLGYDWRNKIVFNLTSKGVIEKTIDIVGEGPNDCGFEISGLCFVNSNTIGVIGSKGVFKYSINSGKKIFEIKRSGLFSQDLGYKLSILNDKSDEYFLSNTLDFNTTKSEELFKKENYLKAKKLLMVDLSNKKFKPSVRFQKSSIYLNDDGYLPSTQISHCFNKKKKQVFLTYIYDPNIYVYDWVRDSLVFKKEIAFSINEYNAPTIIPFGKTISSLANLKNQITSTSIQNIFTSNKNVYIEFMKCLDTDKINSLNSKQEINLYRGDHNVAQIGLHQISFDNNEHLEVLFPDNVMYIQFINNKDQFLVQSFNNQIEDKPNVTKLYVYEIAKSL